MPGEARLQIILDALNLAGSEIKELEKQLGGLNATQEKQKSAWKKMAEAAFDFNNVMGTVSQGLQYLKRGFDLAAEGAQLIRLKDAGTTLAKSFGSDMGDIVKAVQSAAKGTVSELDIIGAANRAMMLGVATDAEQMGQLMEVASARGKAMGLSATQAFSDIVTGIGRMSPLILDNLGIVTGGEKTFEEYAASIGKTSEQLTDSERKQALLNKVLKESKALLDSSGNAALDAAGKFERLGAVGKDAGDRLKAAWGTALAPVVDAAANVLELGNNLETAQAILTAHGMAVETVSASEVRLANGLTLSKEGAIALAGALDQSGPVMDSWAIKATLASQASLQYSRDVGTIPPALAAVRTSTDIAGSGLQAFADTISGQVADALGQYNAMTQFKVGIDDVAAAIARLQDKHITITIDTVQNEIAAQYFRDVTPLAKPGQGTHGSGIGGEQQAEGGPLASFALVGERGPEMIVNGVVIDAQTTRKLMALGLVPGKSFGYGGTIDVAVGGSWPSAPINPDPYGGLGNMDTRRIIGGTIGNEVRMTGGGGGGGGSGTAASTPEAQAVAQVVAQVAEAAVQVAAAVPGQVQAVVSAQTATLQATLQAQVTANRAVVDRLDSILNTLLRQGTSFDTAQAVKEAVQFLPS